MSCTVTSRSRDRLENHNPVSAQPAVSPDRNHINHALSAFTELMGRVLIEKAFFQNNALPAQALLSLANDLLKMVSPKQERVVDMAKELGIFYKQVRGQSLTTKEVEYEKGLKQIDVLAEVGRGLKYSALSLLGQGLFSSLQSTITQRLWTHIPSIALYSGVSVMGAQGICLAVDQVLKNTNLTSEQKIALIPWLNVIGKLALGFTPKVYATQQGVHYHYPSVHGFTQTVSNDMTSTIRGETLTVQRQGELTTPQGIYPATYEAVFKLANIQVTDQEKIQIEVVDQQGEIVRVSFVKVSGPYGDRIDVVSDNQELQNLFTKHLTQPSSTALTPVRSFDEQMAIKMGIRSIVPQSDNSLWSIVQNPALALSAALYIGMGLQSRPGPVAFGTMLPVSMLLNLLLPQSVQASWFSEWWDDATTVNVDTKIEFDATETMRQLSEVIGQASSEVKLIINQSQEVITGTISKISTESEKMLVKFGKLGELLIEKTGNEIAITTDKMVGSVQKGAIATLQVAGLETRLTIGAAGEEARVTFKAMMQEVDLILEKEHGRVQDTSKAVIYQAKTAANEMILSMAGQVGILVKRIGDTFEIQAQKTIRESTKAVNATIKMGGKEIRLTIHELFDRIDQTINKGFNRADFLFGEVAPSAAGFTAYEIMKVLFGKSEVQEIMYKMNKEILKAKTQNKNNLETLQSLAHFVQDQIQTSVSPREKAALYVHLIKTVNQPGDREAKKWMLFAIAGIGFQDLGLIEEPNGWFSSKKVNHFFASVLGEINDAEIQEAFSRKDFSKHLDPALHWIKNSMLNQGATSSAMPFPDLEQLREGTDGIELPVGSIIPYAAEDVPHEYLLCNGSYQEKDVYPELYRTLGEKYGTQRVTNGKILFKLPDYRDHFLKGAKENAKIGMRAESTTKMPKIPFTLMPAGTHTHKVEVHPETTHETTQAGEHKHDLTSAGSHTHSVSTDGLHNHINLEAGAHGHDISEAGDHSHGMDSNGRHNHNHGDYRAVLKADCHHTSKAADYSCGEPNLQSHGWLQDAGDHTHNIHSSGKHRHTISQQADHTHGMQDAGSHTHILDKEGQHSHEMSVAAHHTHKISIPAHTHTLDSTGQHTHELQGGDPQTEPQHYTVGYLIKAKATRKQKTNTMIAELVTEMEKIKAEHNNPFAHPTVILNTIILAICGGLALRGMRR